LPATEWKPELFLEESNALSFPVPVDVGRFSCLTLKYPSCRIQRRCDKIVTEFSSTSTG
jgi:hypothetical protein